MNKWRDFLDGTARGGRYLPWKEVARTTGLSRTTAWRLQKRDDFPAPYAISPGRVAYREDEIEAWLLSRGHSAERPRPTAGRPAASTQAPNPRVASEDEPEAPPPGGPPAVQEPRRQDHSERPGGRALLARPRLKRASRRSQHAQAIAQQILFDF